MRKLVDYVRYDSAGRARGALRRPAAVPESVAAVGHPGEKNARRQPVAATGRSPQTPFDRVRACPDADPAKVVELARIHATLDPFVLAGRIDQQLRRLYELAHHRPAAGPWTRPATGPRPRQQAQKTSVTRLTARRFTAR